MKCISLYSITVVIATSFLLRIAFEQKESKNWNRITEQEHEIYIFYVLVLSFFPLLPQFFFFWISFSYVQSAAKKAVERRS